jgi:sRNA-binding protein
MKKLSVIAIIVAAAFVAGSTLALAQTPPTTVILKGNPMGGVKFDHAAHAKLAGDKCVTCHHASKPEKAAKAKQEKCQLCHEKTATAPMKTTAKLAFHDGLAKKGICIECHVAENAKGKKSPVSPCGACHKKDNV